MRLGGLLAVLPACGRIGFASDDVPPADADPRIAAIFELERGTIVPNFAVIADGQASGGKYIRDDNGEGLTGPGSVKVQFAVPAAGAYFVWARTISPTEGTDSFFLEFDGGGRMPFDTSECIHGLALHWVTLRTFTVTCPNIGGVIAVDLAAGTHEVAVTSREGQSVMDLMLLTADGTFTPSGP